MEVKQIFFIIGQTLGFVAVILGILSYQMKTQKKLLILKLANGLVSAIHYFFLGAFEGVFTEIFAVGISIIAVYQTRQFVKKYKGLILSLLYAVFFTAGFIVIILTKELNVTNVLFGLLPVVANTLQTSAFWMKNEKIMRIVNFEDDVIPYDRAGFIHDQISKDGGI